MNNKYYIFTLYYQINQLLMCDMISLKVKVQNGSQSFGAILNWKFLDA